MAMLDEQPLSDEVFIIYQLKIIHMCFPSVEMRELLL